MFVGRTEELKEIREMIGNGRFESLLLYGRRRIGKTRLLKESVRGFSGKVLYFEAKNALLSDNVSELTRIVNRLFDVRYDFRSFFDVCDFVFSKSREEKIVFIIDELPYLIQNGEQTVSDIRDLIDTYKDQDDVKMKFLVSGSYVDIMKQLVERNSEVYGRFTHILPLSVFDYYDASKFLNGNVNPVQP